MGDETISTTPETAELQTTPELEVDTQTIESESQPDVSNEESEQAEQGTETETKIEQPAKNWEQIAKDNQAAFTRVSQEFAKYKEQQEANKPRLVDEKGKIATEYEQQYRYNVDNEEFLAYDNLARRLDPETRQTVEALLDQARGVYNPNNKQAYMQKMSEIKNYFSSDIVEQIAYNKLQMENQMQSQFNKLQEEFKQQRSMEIASLVDQSDDLKALLYEESDTYSPETFGIIKELFDLTGGVDLDMTQKAITSIKALGVKEYLASQSAQSERQKATVPTGNPITATSSPDLSYNYARDNYKDAVKRFGMEAVDKIIMKGQ